MQGVDWDTSFDHCLQVAAIRAAGTLLSKQKEKDKHFLALLLKLCETEEFATNVYQAPAQSSRYTTVQIVQNDFNPRVLIGARELAH